MFKLFILPTDNFSGPTKLEFEATKIKRRRYNLTQGKIKAKAKERKKEMILFIL